MSLQVFAPLELAGEVRRFLAPFDVDSVVSSIRSIEDGPPLRGDEFLIYLSGREDEEQLAKPLKRLARVKPRVRMVVLYARHADHRSVVLWARAAQRALPDHTEFCFSATEVARALKLRARVRPARRKTAFKAVEIEALRNALGLTQSQLAVSAGVSERTIQNWEAGRVSPQSERRLRDLLELNDTLDRYIAADERQSWLISPNDAVGGAAPRDWIIDGRARDLLWEFRRMQVGEPV